MEKRNYDSVDEIKNDFTTKKLIGKNPGSIALSNPTEYHRAYRFANSQKLKLSNIWIEIGLDVRREPGDKSLEELAVWSVKRSIGGKHFTDLTNKEKNRFRIFAKNNAMELENLCAKLGIITEEVYVYDSLDNVIADIKAKGLFGKTPNEVSQYDSHVTMSNVVRFAERKNYNLSEVWRIAGVQYSETVEMRDGKVLRKFAYSSVEEIVSDLKVKNLIGVSISELGKFDGNTTYANILRFAKRVNISVVDMWPLLNIVPSERVYLQKIDFKSTEEISAYVEKLKLSEKTLKSLRIADKRAYKEILEYAKRKKMQRGEIWKVLGMDTLFTANSIEDIIMLLKKHDLSKSTVAEIRKNEAVHDAVYAYAKKNDIKMGVIWKLLGIKNAYDLKSEQKLV